MKNNGLAELERDQLCKGYWCAFEKNFGKPTDDFITNQMISIILEWSDF